MLGSPLGQGGMARVFRAEDRTLNVPCAVKLLDVPDSLRDQLRTRLQAEAHAMALVQHPNVLRVIDMGTEGGTDWIAMDLAPNGSLDDRFEVDGPLPPREAARLHADILDALQAAHDAGVIHRDVKPSNLLLAADGRVLLADFGIARVADDPHVMRSTRTGMTMGTMAYMAPEQRIDARGVSPAADQYAIAASLYWLVTGWNPVDLFAADEDSARWERLPEPLRPVLFRATRYEPTHRFPDARSMAAALREILPHLPSEAAPVVASELPRTVTLVAGPSGAPIDPDAATLRPPGPSPARRAGLGWFSLGLVALAGVVGVGSWLASPGPVPPEVEVAPPDPGPSPVPTPAVPVVEDPAPESPAPAPLAPEVPPPAPNPVPSTRPIAKAEVPAPPPAEPSTGPTQGPGPLGRWKGSFGGRPCNLELRGTPAALQGTIRVRFGENEVTNTVTGTFDDRSQVLELTDVDPTEDAGSYRVTLSPAGLFEGRFTSRRGQTVPLSFRR